MAVTTVPRKYRASDEGSLDHYLRDISQFPLITREREAEPARRATSRCAAPGGGPGGALR